MRAVAQSIAEAHTLPLRASTTNLVHTLSSHSLFEQKLFSSMVNLRTSFELLRDLDAIPDDLVQVQRQGLSSRLTSEDSDILRAVCSGLLAQNMMPALEEALDGGDFLDQGDGVNWAEQVVTNWAMSCVVALRDRLNLFAAALPDSIGDAHRGFRQDPSALEALELAAKQFATLARLGKTIWLKAKTNEGFSPAAQDIGWMAEEAMAEHTRLIVLLWLLRMVAKSSPPHVCFLVKCGFHIISLE